MKNDAAVRRVVEVVLERTDRAGAMPKSMTIRASDRQVRDAAIRVFSPGMVRLDPHDSSKIRIDLERTDAKMRRDEGISLRDVLYEAAGRAPRNRHAELIGAADQGVTVAMELSLEREGAARAFLVETAERIHKQRGPFFEMAKIDLSGLRTELGTVSQAIEMAEHNSDPTRLANFARRATGSTKGLRPGSSRYQFVADALWKHVPNLAEGILPEFLDSAKDRRRTTLEQLGIFRNESAIDVLCFGGLTFEVGDTTFNEVSQHSMRGQPSRVLLPHIREAQVSSIVAERVVTIENETTFNDYVDWIQSKQRREFVICTDGQANWATIHLLRLIRGAAPSVPVFHWGDLDRSGVLIWRSLRRRTGIEIDHLWMDEATFMRYRNRSQRINKEELGDLRRLVQRNSADVGQDLLGVLQREGRWVEQEAVAEGELIDAE